MMKKKLLTVLSFILITVGLYSNVAFADSYADHTTLYYGSRGADVQILQQDLINLGYLNLSSTTQYFGIMTRDAVMSYQRAKGLTADGIVGHATARSIKADEVVRAAKKYQGVPYVWGGSSPGGFDCSGFTSYVMGQNGITIPRTAASQFTVGTWVDRSALRPGDLVFFTTIAPGASHVGIYIGNGQFINASSGQGKIVITDLSNVYFSPRYIGARRVIN